MKFLLFAGSLRKGSFNKKLLALAAQTLEKAGQEINVMDLAQLDFPIYNAEIEERGIPGTVLKLGQAVTLADAIVICSPEYNGGMSGVLKNSLDWVSRIKPMPWKNKPLLLMAASPGTLGGTRGLWHGRVPFEAAGCYVFPEMFGLPKADQAFDTSGALIDPKSAERLQALLDAFIKHAKSLIF